MQFSFKVGNSVLVTHPAFNRKWQHLQLIDIRPNGYYNLCYYSKVFNLIIETPQDYWTLRGSTDWKSIKPSVLNLKKYLCPVDMSGKLPWQTSYLKNEKTLRKRDWSLDWDKFKVAAKIDKATEELALNPHKYCEMLHYDGDIFQLLNNYYDIPIIGNVQNQPWSTGTKTIGAAGDATDVNDAESKTAAQLTGNLTWDHLDEETALGGTTTWDLDTNTYLLKITAQSGAEHDGAAYGNGARINYGAFERMDFDETTPGDLDNVEVSKLAFDVGGDSNLGIRAEDGGDADEILFNRLLVKGDADTTYALYSSENVNHTCRNCIVYDISGGNGIQLKSAWGGGKTVNIYNNTSVKNNNNFVQIANAGNNNLNFKNNLAQDDQGGDDYVDGGVGWGTNAKNISEDATSPNAAYRNKDLHTNSVFINYAADNIKIDKDGNVVNLAIVDDGEDLSGTFTDDINHDAGRRP